MPAEPWLMNKRLSEVRRKGAPSRGNHSAEAERWGQQVLQERQEASMGWPESRGEGRETRSGPGATQRNLRLF